MSDQSASKPFGLFERMLALRYLRATRRGAGVSLISAIAFLGILLSVATLIVVMSVMQGFRITLLEQLLGVNGHVFVQPVDKTLPDGDGYLETLESVDGVTFVVPVLKVEAFALAPSGGQAPVYIQGVARDDLMKIEEVTGPRSLLEGSFDGYGVNTEDPGIVIAYGVANKLQARAGEYITLVTNRQRETPFGTLPTTQKSYRIDAVFRIGNYEYDNILAYMPIEEAQLFSGKRGQITEIEMRVEKPIEIDLYLDAIREAAGPGVLLFDWRDRFKTFFNALQTERGLMRIILSLIIAIATLNIISSLVMLVKDKTSDIAVMRTVGATANSVMRIFLMVGALIGVTGAILGVITGVALASNLGPLDQYLCRQFDTCLFPPDVYYLSEVPFAIDPGEVLFVLVFALSMALLSSAYPAWRASKLDPVEALRYE
ncbi:lipoprotein-releasing ABC transporter permease subunit [Parvularcula lutaonensis]|uniref:Lipoprotein-releasing ABC transporter permease subunit n=1 Tax=Parvularcula lutaonensis TaxID=491923 RepID=A0ABV7M7V0_9PROT|nr:lipoprotein-releasing ABC transporter permease subunit [Parvularcula lutaonensis]GGY43180.1 ABC transporter permease [Parvularcula lutaonensis]